MKCMEKVKKQYLFSTKIDLMECNLLEKETIINDNIMKNSKEAEKLTVVCFQCTQI